MFRYDDDDFLRWLIKFDNKRIMENMEKKSTHNYLRFTDFSLLYTHYAYVDTANYYADFYLNNRKVHVKYGKEWYRDDNEYKVIFCKVPKWQERKFVLAMQELKDKMLICGHSDYLDFCKKIIEDMCSK